MPHPLRAGLLVCALGMAGFASPALAQATDPPTLAPGAPEYFDPARVYFDGWTLSRDAEKLELAGKHRQALEKITRARELFDSVQLHAPLWKPKMVKGRISKTLETIDRIEPMALEESERRTGGRSGQNPAPEPPAGQKSIPPPPAAQEPVPPPPMEDPASTPRSPGVFVALGIAVVLLLLSGWRVLRSRAS